MAILQNLRSWFVSLTLLSLTLGVVSPGFADMVLTIGNGEIQIGNETRNPFAVVQQGGSGSIRFSVTASGESFSLDGYNIYFDVSPSGFQLPAGVTFTGASPVSGGFNADGIVNLDSSAASLANIITMGNGNYDFIVDDARSGGLPLSAGQTTNLLDLNFSTSLSAAVGIYDVRFVASPSLFVGSQFQTNPNGRNIVAYSGSFEITAVPEPSSLVMSLIGLVGGLHLCRRKQRKLVSSQAA